MKLNTQIIKKHINIDLILNEIFYEYNKLDKIDDDQFYDYKHYYIDNYVSLVKNKRNMKKFIDDYGIFNAIKLYEENYGNYDIDDNEIQNYCKLAYNLIDDYINLNIDQINIEYLNIEDIDINIG